MFFWRQTEAKDTSRQQEFERGQKAMLDAASWTASAADDLAETLRRDSRMESEHAALLICNEDGKIKQCNDRAIALFRRDVASANVDDILRHGYRNFASLIRTVGKDYPANLRMMAQYDEKGVPVDVKVMRLNNQENSQSIMLSLRSLQPKDKEFFRVVAHSVEDTIGHIKERVG